MHFSHLKPSESPSFLDNLRLLLPLLLYTIPQPFPFIKASLKNEIAPFHSLICETLSRRRKRRKKREKMQIFKMFCVANFFLSFAKSRSCFVSKLFEKWEIFGVWFHFDGWKSSARNPPRVLCHRSELWKQAHYFIFGRGRDAIKSIFMFRGLDFVAFIAQQIKKAGEFQAEFKFYLFR
jgi:hypothetical protein